MYWALRVVYGRNKTSSRKPLLLWMTEVGLIPKSTAHPYGEMSREGPRKGQGLHRLEEKVFVKVGSAWDGTWPDTVEILKRD